MRRCRSDADILIAMAALEEARSGRRIVSWGDNTDLLVISLHHIELLSLGSVHICIMYRPSSVTCIDVYRLAQLIEGKLRDMILALHAISGCDTTSALYGMGRQSYVNYTSSMRRRLTDCRKQE